MFDKLKEISKIFLPLSIILYVFGFISLTSFLARFGIISFDIINSRFVIAGFFSFIAISTAIMIIWQLFRSLPLKNIFEKNGWKERIKAYASFSASIWGASYVLYLLFNLGEYTPPANQENLIFKPWFGRYDYVGNLINKIELSSSPGYEYVLKFSLYIFFFIVIIMAIMSLAKIIYRYFSNKKDRAESTEKAIVIVPSKEMNQWQRASIILLETLLLIIFVMIGFYAYFRIRVGLFDFNSFSTHQKLSVNIIFCWLYATIITTFVFMKMLFPKEKPPMDLFKNFENVTTLNNIQVVFQHIFIPILGSLIIFGQTIFPRIPFAIGGGEPREIDIKTHQSMPFGSTDKIFLIGESSQFIFVVDYNKNNPQALQINKSEIEYIRTRKSAPR